VGIKSQEQVDLVCCTVLSVGDGFVTVISPDFLVYNFQLKKNFKPMAGEMIWVYRVKKKHIVIDHVLYKNNEDLGDSFDSYFVQV